MASPLDPFKGWAGAWFGEGESAQGARLLVHCTLEPSLFDVALRMDLRLTEEGRVVFGVAATVGPALDGTLKAAGFGTLPGAFTLEQTPDDEGVLALSGTDLGGAKLGLSLVEENSNLLLFTLKWGAQVQFSAELARLVPTKSPARIKAGLEDTQRAVDD